MMITKMKDNNIIMGENTQPQPVGKLGNGDIYYHFPTLIALKLLKSIG